MQKEQKSNKNKYARERKPLIVLVCEGRNKTETIYFNHFNKRDNPYNLKIYPSEATDPKSMHLKAKNIINELQLDNSIGDRIFCLVDIDLNQNQANKIIELRKLNSKQKCKIEFIVSNPCFEIWLLYYFTKHPKIENSSQNVKKQLKKYDSNYSENYDIISKNNLNENYLIALNNADLKNNTINKNIPLEDKNPYTEIVDLINLLTNYKK